MSVFVNNLKTFTSDITGEEREYKINNAVWVLMRSKFKLGQREWADRTEKEEVIYAAKFVTCVLLANGIEVTEEEVLNNTDNLSLMEFITAYNMAMFEKNGESEEESEDDSEKK